MNDRSEPSGFEQFAGWLASTCPAHAASPGNASGGPAHNGRDFAHLQSLIDILPLNLVVKDADGRRVFANQRYLDYQQARLDDVLGKTDEDLFCPDDARRFRADDEQVLATGVVLRGMEVRTLPDDARHWIERIKGPVRNAAGAIVGVYTLLSDVSKNVQDAAALDLERDLLNSLMDNIPDAIYFKDLASRFLRISRSQAEQFGLASPAEAIGKSDADIFTEEHAQNALRDEQRIIETGQPLVAQVEKETWADRDATWVSTTKMPLRDRNGRITGTFGISRDVTQLMRMQDELAKARDAAEAASRTKSEFLANMSHEIRTPMNGIIGMTELLLNTRVTNEQREYLSLVQSSADALLALLNDVLDFSKIEAGKLELDESEFPLRDTLGMTLHSLAARAAQKGLELAVHIVPDAPDRLVGDAGRLRQILVNLVGNAIKFTEAGEVVVRVQPVSAADGVATLRFSVTDTGIGIAPEQQDRIFEAFTQADASTTREYGGTGLGLTISTQLVKRMGGEIWVESQPGQGSTFHFTAQFQVPAAQDDVASRTVATLFDLPVLVVDDNATNRLICEEMLANWGMKPTVVASGAEALVAFDRAAAAGRSFRLALVDVMMPQMDGFEVVEHLRRRPAAEGLTLVLLSSADHPEHSAHAKELGVARCIVKPVTQSMLLNGITAALGTARGDEIPQSNLIADRPADFTSRRILLAEDGEVNRKVAIALLQQRGHHVTAVTNGQEAVDAYNRDKFDLVLLDVQMPVLDGFGATAAIRQSEAGTDDHVPIVAMTAHAMKGDRERCLAAGMDAYVSKPFRPHELFAEVERPRGPAPTPDNSGPGWMDDGSLLAATRAAASRPGARRRPYDHSEALKNVGGSASLLAEMAALLAYEAPQQMAAIETAYGARDADALSRAAHSLKGSVSLFGAAAAMAGARRIEELARTGRLDEFPPAWADLQQLVQELLEALGELTIATPQPPERSF